MPRSAWVMARRARWKACECALANPGRVRPGRRSAEAAGAAGVTEVKCSPSASIRTSRQTPWPGSQARSASQRLHRRPRQVLKDQGQRADPGFAVGQVGVLGGRMRDAGGVAHEQHRRRHPRREHPGVVPGPGGQHRRRHPGRGEHPGDPVPQPLVETDDRGVRLLPDAERHPVLRTKPPCGRTDRGDCFLQRGLVWCPGVQPRYDRRRNPIGATRLGDHLAERGQCTVTRGGVAGREDGSRVGQHRIFTVGQPGRAGVVGAALEIKPPPAVRPDPLGQAEGGAHRGERAALLDVQFDERGHAVQQVGARTEQARVAPGGGHRRGQRVAVVVGEGPRGLRVDGAGDQAAAQAGNAKPSAFFLGEQGKHDGPFGIKVFIFKHFHGGQRGHHAERSVVAPAIRDRVQMAAGRDGVRSLLALWVSCLGPTRPTGCRCYLLPRIGRAFPPGG